MGPVSDFLVIYLDAIDERLLEHLDQDDELKVDAVQRLRFYASALLEGAITPLHVADDWPDWYHLGPAFVAAYGTEVLKALEDGASGVPGFVSYAAVRRVDGGMTVTVCQDKAGADESSRRAAGWVKENVSAMANPPVVTEGSTVLQFNS